MQSDQGAKDGGRLHVKASSGCILFGPYLDLPPGHIVARVVLGEGARGKVKMEIVAEKGTRVLVSELFDLAEAGGVLTLEADIANLTANVEVRLFAKGKVALDVIGVEIDLDRVMPTETLHAGRPVGFETGKSYAAKIASGFFDAYMSGPNVMEIGYKGYEGATVPVVPQAIGVDVGYPGYEGATFPFADGSFDAIYSSHCFEHIGDWLGVLRDWYRLLRVGGFLVIVVPHQLLFERKRKLPSPINPDHKRFYTPVSLLSEIEAAFEENSYRIRHLVENDAGFDYSIMPYQGTDGCYEIELVVEKIAKPFWHPDNGSVRAYPAGDFRTPLVKASPWEIELDLTQKNQCAVFGPYIGLDASNYIAEFHFDWAGGPVPDLVLDVALFGERIAMTELRRGDQDYTSGKIEIPFTNPRHGEIFEFRVYVGGSVPVSDAWPKFRGVVVRYAGY
ncbi:MAG TPA: class I SAM-dependent methyltransferase [Sphingomonas sp.]|uniref:class I SAM-dependent methyltransferase n=1 Tax=Sphingomonas sp. TaxID=28214 RepID=UPI002C72DD0B|nr:class I SAM-dependent methyltransferase [Sphingomonas sp.]HMI20266.1 class I SAM-dependent methyltransferase [Sphingomonas sp.]